MATKFVRWPRKYDWAPDETIAEARSHAIKALVQSECAFQFLTFVQRRKVEEHLESIGAEIGKGEIYIEFSDGKIRCIVVDVSEASWCGIDVQIMFRQIGANGKPYKTVGYADFDQLEFFSAIES